MITCLSICLLVGGNTRLFTYVRFICMYFVHYVLHPSLKESFLNLHDILLFMHV